MNDGGDKNCLNVSFLSSLFIENTCSEPKFRTPGTKCEKVGLARES